MSLMIGSSSGMSSYATTQSLASRSSASPTMQQSAGDMNRMLATLSQDLFASLDSDNSNGIDSTEFSTAARAMAGETSGSTSSSDVFGSLDSNGDGVISQDELTSALSASAQNGAMMPPPPGGMPPPPPSSDTSSNGDTGYTKEELTAMSGEATSTDGNLSALMGKLAKNFDAADTNGDGKVSASEARAYQESKTSSSGQSASASSATGSSNTASASDFEQMLLQRIISYYSSNSATSNVAALTQVSA